MKSFIRPRVVKSQTVEVSIPRLVECKNEEFLHLGNHISVVREITEEPPIPLCESDGNIEENAEQSEENTKCGAETQTAQLIIEAETQAQAILAQAQAEAEQIRTSVQNEVAEFRKKIREEAEAKGQAEGYEKGFRQGQAEGWAQAKPEIEEKLQEATRLLQLVQRAAKEEWSKVDGDLLQLAVKIAERVVRASLAVTPDLLLHQIKALTLFPQSREGWTLHVSPDDFIWLTQMESQDRLQVNFVSDDTLHQGDSFLECSEGIFDARLEVQLTHLEYLLKEELKHGGLESARP